MRPRVGIPISAALLRVLQDGEKVRELERAVSDEFWRLNAERIDRQALEMLP